MKKSSVNSYIALECGQAQDTSLDRFELSALPHNAASARERIRGVCERLGFGHLEIGEIEVAVGEAVNNAILYGSPHLEDQIAITCCLRHNPPQPAALIIQIRDRGRGFDPQTVIEGDSGTDALGGRGLGLMCALMDEVAGFYDGTGMVIRMARALPQCTQTQSAP